MAYQVDFGIINKKVNSTATNFTVTLTASCSLKVPCDVMQPTFLLQADFNPLNNYFYVSDFGRYYWITGSRFNSGQWEITGITDVLASFKTAIGSQLQYIVRQSNPAYRNDYLIDALALAQTNPEADNSLEMSLGLNSTGSFMVCCAGYKGNNYFSMPGANWEQLYAAVFTSGFLQTNMNIWDSITHDFANTVYKPEDYIITAKWLPCAPSGVPDTISLGFVDTQVTGYKTSPGVPVFGPVAIDWDIPAHPDAAAYGHFLNSNAFRKITLSLPGYGNVVLDADALGANGHIKIIATMDVMGLMTYHVRYGVGKQFYVTTDLSADAGFNVTKSSISNAVAGIGDAAGLAIGGNVVGAGLSVISGIVSALPQVERASSGGSRSAIVAGDTVKVNIINYRIAGFSGVKVGYATCKTMAPSTCGGYIETKNASVQCTGTEAEINKINNYMNGGFYYE